ncbi:MAG: tetratricopeptide repeat protein [Bryobacteraceae bacterium]|jgi:tetratricopeptide (TPR) repeat protein
MRELLLFLIAAVPVVCQPAGSPIPEAVRQPRQQDLLNYDISLAVSGRVLLEDRQPPPEPVLVEYSCRGTSQGVVTDAKGRFSIPIGSQQGSRTNVVVDRSAVEGCRVQIHIPGFEEVLVPVKPATKIASLTVGDLTLKQVGPQANAVFSASARSAPPKARSNFVKGYEATIARKYPDALSALDKAIAAYPQYASALQLKGNVLGFMGQRDAAREVYQQAVAADPAYATPLVQLAEMAAADQKAEDAVRWAAMVNRLVPGGYPGVYLIEGGADFVLGHYDDAEKVTRAGIAADPKGTCPGLRKLMGEVLFRKRNYAAALDQFEWYLKEAPDAADAASAQQRLQTCKRLAKTASN